MLKTLTKAALQRVGLDVQRYRPWKHLHVFFESWKTLGLDPRFVVDVGANHGDWTRTARTYFPNADYLLIEPQAELKIHAADLLQSPKVQWKNVGVSDTPGILELHLATRDDSASFRPLPPSVSRADASAVFVEVATLDSIMSELDRKPDLVKIDAEGYDLRVLQGATTLLESTECILIECALCGRDFSNTLRSIVNFLSARDYTLVDFTDLNRSPNQNLLWLCEAAFLKNNSPLWQKISGYEQAPAGTHGRSP
jgi:FkbM family methyltransferase